MPVSYKIKASSLVVLFILCSCLFSTVYAAFNPKNISVGVLAFRGQDVAKKRWGPTIQYLNEQLPEYHFNLVPKDLKTLNSLVKDQDLDFILTNTGHYVLLESLYGITRIATLRNLRQGKALDSFGSVIFTRANRTDINKLSDFTGKSFMGVNKNGFGGFQIAWREFKQAGIDPFSDFSSLSFSGFPQSNIVHAVLEGRVDGGTMRTDSLERLAAKRKINIDDIKIINAKSAKGFPFLLSSELYPEWPFSTAQHVPLEVAKKVAIALFQIKSTSDVARQGNYSEWTVPSDYQPVHELMRELKIGSYAEKNQFDFNTIINTYWLEILTLGIAIVIIAYLVFLLRRRNTALLHQQEMTKSKFKFLANVLKETHTVLDSLVNYGNKIDPDKAPASQGHIISRMLDSSANISTFFNNIQEFSLIESDRVEFEKAKFNLIDILEEIRSSVADNLQDKKITLSMTVNDDVPNMLVGDSERLKQIIQNILKIAIKFSHEASVSLDVESLKSSAGKVQLKFNITDSHMVINQGQIDMLFNSFVHADTLNIQNYGSACLSLYVSKKFIELMGGNTWVENGADEQRVFSFSCQFKPSK